MLIKYKNGRLMIIILAVIICVFGVGIIVFNKYTIKNDYEDEAEEEINSTAIIKDIGLSNGYIDVNNDIVQSLFNYFREDRNCISDYNDISNNKTKLVIAFNNLYENQLSSINCKDLNKLTINDKYFCSNDLNDIDKDTYKIGINSSSFLNSLKQNNTSILDSSLMEETIHNIFGSTTGYINESFLFGSDSYIYFDSNNNRYVMYKYYSDKTCSNNVEEIESAYSNNGVLELRMILKNNNSIIKKTILTFNYNQDNGEYIITNKSTY